MSPMHTADVIWRIAAWLVVNSVPSVYRLRATTRRPTLSDRMGMDKQLSEIVNDDDIGDIPLAHTTN